MKAESELNKNKEELLKAQSKLKLAEARVDKYERMAAGTIDEIKVAMEVWIAQAPEEAISDTCSGFLYTLWLKHPEMDFSFFGREAVEKVKRYAIEVVENTEASTPLDSTEVVLPAANAEVQPAEAAEIQLVKATEVQPAKVIAPLS